MIDETSKRQRSWIEDEKKKRLGQNSSREGQEHHSFKSVVSRKEKSSSRHHSPGDSLSKISEYAKLPLHMLRRLEDVRDAKSSCIL